MGRQIDATLSNYAEAWLHLDGKPFRLDLYPMLREIYDGRYRKLMILAARQVTKSTTLCSMMTLESILKDHFRSIYIGPSQKAARYFSISRVGKTLKFSPALRAKYSLPELVNRVEHKELANGSEMLFLYANESEEDADRLRGPSSDHNNWDEVQDMLYDPIIIVGNEMMSKSRYKYETYTGTPKSMENTIQFLWEQSTQTEWVMKCDGCGRYTYIDGEKFIGKEGPICIKCGHLLNPFEGQWVDMAPGKDFKGFHISQPNLPENVPYAMRNSSNEMKELADMNWKIILNKYNTFPISKFRNEILGVSDAIGARLISKEELEALCCSYHIQQVPHHTFFNGISMIIGGVDWSGGGTTGVSRTVLWLWGLVKETQKLRCMFYKVFPGTHPVETCQEIGKICNDYKVTLVVADAGEGHHANGELRKLLGAHRLMPLQYGSQAKALVYNGVDRYTGNRTTLIDNYLMLLKQGRAEFASIEDMRTAITDILSEYEEVTITGNKVWRHSPQRPDDCLHAGLYGWLAWKITTSDLLFYQ